MRIALGALLLLALDGCGRSATPVTSHGSQAAATTTSYPEVSEEGVYTRLHGSEVYGYVGFASTAGFGTEWTIRIDLNEHESVSVAGAEHIFILADSCLGDGCAMVKRVQADRLAFEFENPYAGGSHLLLWVVPTNGDAPRKYYETLVPLWKGATHP